MHQLLSTRRFVSTALIVHAICAVTAADEIPLTGTHRFAVGDDPAWSAANYDDADWDLISVPQNWDDAGLKSSAWVGWYRIRFDGREWMKNSQPAVLLGPVSDADEVWLNGSRIGGIGTIADRYETSGLLPRLYSLPKELLNHEGENVLAVRVMRVYFSGGILASAQLAPTIGDYRELSNRVMQSRRHTEIAITVIFTVWIGAVVFGLVIFRESELRSAFRILAAVMLLYLAAYVFEIPEIVHSSLHNPITELLLNLSLCAAPWMFLTLTNRILQQPPTRWHVPVSVTCAAMMAISVVLLTPADRILILGVTLVLVLLPGIVGGVTCIRAVLQRIPGAVAYSLGFVGLLVPSLAYGFPSLLVQIDHVPLDAYAAAFFVLCCFAVLMTRYRILRQRMELTSHALMTAQEDERRRLSRELHDGVNQSVFAVRLALQMEEEKLRNGDEVASTALADLVKETEQIGDELRRVVRELRPAILEQMDIAAAIRWQAEEFSKRGGLEIQIDAESGIVTSDTVKDHLYRIFQEALQNTLRHADATEAKVMIRQEGDRVRVSYSDNGQGFGTKSARPDGHGLNTMRERAGLLGGYCEISSSPGNGTVVDVRVPCGIPIPEQAR